jgi:glycosyltransferase involved in cell wall biosynthesis
MAGRVPTPRLAFISHHFRQNDGQGRVNYEVVKAALEAGSKVTILAISCDDDLARHHNCDFVQIGSNSLPTELLRNLVFARGSGEWLRRNRSQVDVVLANGFVTWEPCDLVAAHFVHAAWYKSSWYPFKKFAPYALYQWLYTVLNVRWEKQAFLRAKRVIAVSKILVDELLDIGVAREKIEVVINGIDIEQFHPGSSERAYFALPPGTLALFVGDLKTPRKNLEAVLAALQRVPDLSLAVAGDLERSPYPALARKLGVDNRVFFLDKVSRMADLMRSADMFVFPSRYEPFGLVVLEAMASGTPVIVSACSGVAEYVKEAGLVLEDPNDIKGLTTCMATLAASAENRAAMGAAGRRQSLEMQWSDCTRGYLSVFDKVLSQSS